MQVLAGCKYLQNCLGASTSAQSSGKLTSRSGGSGLGKERWPVERTISWLHNARRLRVRFDRLDCIHEAFVKLQLCLICHAKVRYC